MKWATLHTVGWNQKVQFRAETKTTLREVTKAVDAELERWGTDEAMVVIHAGCKEVLSGSEPHEEVLNDLRARLQRWKERAPNSRFVVYALPVPWRGTSEILNTCKRWNDGMRSMCRELGPWVEVAASSSFREEVPEDLIYSENMAKDIGKRLGRRLKEPMEREVEKRIPSQLGDGNSQPGACTNGRGTTQAERWQGTQAYVGFPGANGTGMEKWIESLQQRGDMEGVPVNAEGPYTWPVAEEQTSADLRMAPTDREIKRAMKRVDAGTAPGCDGLPMSLIKALGPKAREKAVAKAGYENRLVRLPEQNVARRMLVHTIFAGRSTRWTRRTAALRRHFGLPAVCLERANEEGKTKPGEGVWLKVHEVETTAWRDSAATKSSLEIYRGEKPEISTERIYDNSRGSALLAEARVGVLRTRLWRARFTEGLAKTCALCGGSDETLSHVVLECCEIRPPAGTAALPIALGFSVEGGELRKVVEVTKRRLEYWWRRGALRV
ncbi:hypothetical protein HPB52_006212 [Rhipicephalus sanguineus]|uniref:Tick transposon n=1 Tax=Rhipicephalus sanguineus TaxID=34632 RepID=A0A9D4QGV8_RHISA|nr:hypothetical protein HPB52_006212 [Rhipicephalus sanguineus]